MFAFYLNWINSTIFLFFSYGFNWMLVFLLFFFTFFFFSIMERANTSVQFQNAEVAFLLMLSKSISLSYWATLWLITVIYSLIHCNLTGKFSAQCYPAVPLSYCPLFLNVHTADFLWGEKNHKYENKQQTYCKYKCRINIE